MTLATFQEFERFFFVAAFVFFGFLIGNLRERLKKVEAELDRVTKIQKPLGL
jgi:hypothetical protein